MMTQVQPHLTPCYKCEEQDVGCHGSCAKYAAFKMHIEDIRQEAKKDDMHRAYNEKHKSKFLSNSSHRK